MCWHAFVLHVRDAAISEMTQKLTAIHVMTTMPISQIFLKAIIVLAPSEDLRLDPDHRLLVPFQHRSLETRAVE